MNDYLTLYQTHIRGIKGAGSQFTGLCPFHEDHNRSFSGNRKSGLSICHAGCGSWNAYQFAESIGIDPKPYYRNGNTPINTISSDIHLNTPLGKDDTDKAKYYVKYLQDNWDSVDTPKAWIKSACKFISGYDPETKRLVFIHHDNNGTPLNIKRHKGINGNKGYSVQGHGENRLYPLLLIEGFDSEKVLVICEGEKDAVSLISKGIQAMTATTGAYSIPEDLTPLQPFKRIYVCYDDDSTGDDGSVKMAMAIKEKFPQNEVNLFRWNMLNPVKGWDITDYFSKGHSRAEFWQLLKANSKQVETTPKDKVENPKDDSPKFPEIKVFSLGEMLKDGTPPPPSIISHGILPKNGILLLHGSPKAGKSLLSCNLALSIASGQNWYDFTINQCFKTLIIQAEVNYFPLRDRLKTMMAKDEYKKAKTNVSITEAKGFDILSEEGIFHLQRWIIKFKPEVIIFDPLKDYHYMEENSNTDMALVFQRFRQIAESNDVSLIIVHHSKKYNDSGSGGNIRGASNIFGSIDGAIELSISKDKNRKLKFDLRYGKQPDDLTLILNEFTLFFEKTDNNPANENESVLLEIVKANEPDGISKTKLKEKWMNNTDKGKSTFATTFKLCENQLELIGNKIHILSNVLPL